MPDFYRITGTQRRLTMFTSLTRNEVERVDTVSFNDTSTFFHHNGVIVSPTKRGFAIIQDDELTIARLPDNDVLSSRKFESFRYEELPIDGDGYYVAGVYALEDARAVVRAVDEEHAYLVIESSNLEDAQNLYDGILDGSIEPESYFGMDLANALDTIFAAVENIPQAEALAAFAGVRGRVDDGIEEGELAVHPTLSSEPIFIARLENGLGVAMFVADVALVTAEQKMPAEAEPEAQPEAAAMTDTTEHDTAAPAVTDVPGPEETTIDVAEAVASSEPAAEPAPVVVDEPPSTLPVMDVAEEAVPAETGR